MILRNYGIDIIRDAGKKELRESSVSHSMTDSCTWPSDKFLYKYTSYLLLQQIALARTEEKSSGDRCKNALFISVLFLFQDITGMTSMSSAQGVETRHMI